MVEAGAGFRDVVGHGEVNGALLIVPEQVDATEDLAMLVDGDIIVLFEAID